MRVRRCPDSIGRSADVTRWAFARGAGGSSGPSLRRRSRGSSAGSGGAPLVAPAGRGTRPTSDKVREAIFDVLCAAGGAPAVGVAGAGALAVTSSSTCSPAAAPSASRRSRAAPHLHVRRERPRALRRARQSERLGVTVGGRRGAAARRGARPPACSPPTRAALCRLTLAAARDILCSLRTLRTTVTRRSGPRWPGSWAHCSRRAPCSSSRRPPARRPVCRGPSCGRSATATRGSPFWWPTTCPTKKEQLQTMTVPSPERRAAADAA